jgi:hypothetical protein
MGCAEYAVIRSDERQYCRVVKIFGRHDKVGVRRWIRVVRVISLFRRGAGERGKGFGRDGIHDAFGYGEFTSSTGTRSDMGDTGRFGRSGRSSGTRTDGRRSRRCRR